MGEEVEEQTRSVRPKRGPCRWPTENKQLTTLLHSELGSHTVVQFDMYLWTGIYEGCLEQRHANGKQDTVTSVSIERGMQELDSGGYLQRQHHFLATYDLSGWYKLQLIHTHTLGLGDDKNLISQYMSSDRLILIYIHIYVDIPPQDADKDHIIKNKFLGEEKRCFLSVNLKLALNKPLLFK